MYSGLPTHRISQPWNKCSYTQQQFCRANDDSQRHSMSIQNVKPEERTEIIHSKGKCLQSNPFEDAGQDESNAENVGDTMNDMVIILLHVSIIWGGFIVYKF